MPLDRRGAPGPAMCEDRRDRTRGPDAGEGEANDIIAPRRRRGPTDLPAAARGAGEGAVPPEWDDVLLPDDRLPVGIPAAARGPVHARGADDARAVSTNAVPVKEVRARATPADAVPASAADRARANLLMMTCLGTADGTILLLAATGRLASVAMAIVVGLTVVSGIGAWIAAYAAFGGRRPGRRDYSVLARMAGISIAATVAAAWLGVALGQAVTFHILPKAAGVVLFLVAAEVWGVRLPRPGRVPMPLAAIALAAVLEVLLWIP